MSKSVFVKAWLKTDKGDLDISDTVEWFRRTSDHEKGELVEFRFKSDKSIDLGNHKNMVVGGVIYYQFGFIKDVQSSIHLCRVGAVECDFSDKRVQVIVKATDKGIEIKKSASQKVWHNITLSGLCQEIATKYGLDYIGDTTTHKYTSLPQAGRSDWELINYMISREPSGLYHLSVQGTQLILEKDQRSKKSARGFVYGDNVISFRTQFKEITQKPNIASPASLGIDEKTGKITTPKANTTSELRDGKFSVTAMEKSNVKKKQVGTQILRDVDGNKIGERPIYAVDNGNTTNPTDALGSFTNEKNKAKVLTGELLIELDPSRHSGEMITVTVPIDRYSGNWYIENAQHTIDKSGGFTQLTLNKNGTNKPSKNGTATNDGKVNNTEGGKNAQQTVRIYRDVNGNKK